MLSIIMNGSPTQIGAPLPPAIDSLQIVCVSVAVPSHQIPQIRAWLSAVRDRISCDYVEMNGVLLATSDFREEAS